MNGARAQACGEGVLLGIYEKALTGATLEEVFASARRAGFSFVDLSIDETPERLARLRWTERERTDVRAAAHRQGITIGGICLSAHRATAPGSRDAGQRARAAEMLVDAIDLCVDLGVPVLQIAGYYAYYEEPRAGARADYVEVLRAGARHAARRGVVLGLENVDGADVVSTEEALRIVDEIGSPWFQLYPDVGNFVVQALDVVPEVTAAAGRAVAWHVKEARPGEPRRVPLGEGAVPWHDAFVALAATGWNGRIMIEMWNDDAPESESIARAARMFVTAELEGAGIPVMGPPDAGGS